MGLTPTVEESLTETLTHNTAFSAAMTFVSLHSANPGSTGVNELSSSSYARQPVSFSASPGGGVDDSNVAVNWTLQGGDTAYWYGFWTAVTAGSFLGGFPLVGPPKLAVASSFDNPTQIRCPAHGFATGTKVRLFAEPGIPSSAVPAGYAPDTPYAVSVVDADTISLGATATSSAGFWVGADYSNAFTTPGLYGIPLGNLVYETVS